MDIAVETIGAVPVLGILEEVAAAAIGEAIGRLMPELMAAAGDRAAGPPLARWHAWQDDRGTMELAVPVRGGAKGSGRVEKGTLPGGRAVVATHVGPYTGLADAWRRVREWIREKGLEGRDAPWEVYLSDCREVPAERLQTRIVWPVR